MILSIFTSLDIFYVMLGEFNSFLPRIADNYKDSPFKQHIQFHSPLNSLKNMGMLLEVEPEITY